MLRNNLFILFIEKFIVELPDCPLSGLMLNSFRIAGVFISEPPKDHLICRSPEFKFLGENLTYDLGLIKAAPA